MLISTRFYSIILVNSVYSVYNSPFGDCKSLADVYNNVNVVVCDVKVLLSDYLCD